MCRLPARRAAALTVLPLLSLGLAACGEDTGTATGAGLEAVSVTGAVGTAPKVTWNERVETDSLESEVLVKGQGEEVAGDDQVITHVWIGNGFSQRQAFSTYEAGEPQLLATDDADLLTAFRTALDGQTIGSRVLVVAPPADAFGEQGNPSLDIGNEDGVVFVVDLTAKVLDGPSGQPRRAPADAPRVVEQDGVPTGLDFAAASRRPSEELQVITLVRGDGTKVAKGDTTLMNYLGQVYGRTKIFDQSYDKEPFSTTIGQGQVIKGWDQGLVGLPVGSRVLLVIPPDLAYGEKGSGADIPGDATLTFVVDLLAAY